MADPTTPPTPPVTFKNNVKFDTNSRKLYLTGSIVNAEKYIFAVTVVRPNKSEEPIPSHIGVETKRPEIDLSPIDFSKFPVGSVPHIEMWAKTGDDTELDHHKVCLPALMVKKGAESRSTGAVEQIAAEDDEPENDRRRNNRDRREEEEDDGSRNRPRDIDDEEAPPGDRRRTPLEDFHRGGNHIGWIALIILFFLGAFCFVDWYRGGNKDNVQIPIIQDDGVVKHQLRELQNQLVGQNEEMKKQREANAEALKKLLEGDGITVQNGKDVIKLNNGGRGAITLTNGSNENGVIVINTGVMNSTPVKAGDLQKIARQFTPVQTNVITHVGWPWKSPFDLDLSLVNYCYTNEVEDVKVKVPPGGDKFFPYPHKDPNFIFLITPDFVGVPASKTERAYYIEDVNGTEEWIFVDQYRKQKTLGYRFHNLDQNTEVEGTFHVRRVPRSKP